MYPKILYWKWNDDLLDKKILKEKIDDIVKRSIFDVVAMSPHGMQNHDVSLRSPEMKSAIKEAVRLLGEHGRKFTVETNVGQYAEFPKILKKAPGKFAHLTRLYDADLDEDGRAVIDVVPASVYKVKFSSLKIIKPVIGFFGAWIVDPCENLTFASGSEKEAAQFCRIVDIEDGLQQIVVDAGKENAKKRVILYPDVKLDDPDKLSDEYRCAEVELIEDMGDTGVFGVTVDEWGLRTPVRGGVIADIYISDDTKLHYFNHCGRDLYKDLLYFHYTPSDAPELGVLVVNKYMETIRNRLSGDEEAIYDTAKRTFGKDAFVGFHPTWYCAPNGFALEAPYNGIDWWQVKRDYSQTDERVMIPIRLAMARGATKPVWYNMWYSQSTLDIKTYFRETWVNARFGGRTTYLGYECYEPDVVLTLWQEGRLESVSDADAVATKINDFQTTLPDSRVLCLFAMEQFTNWQITAHGAKAMTPGMAGHRSVVAFANKLFANNVLFDLVPSSDVDRGKLRVENRKIKYHSHDYDALIVVGPDGMTQKSVDFIKECASLTKNVAMVGECRYLNDGSACKEGFDTISHKFPAATDASEIAELIKSWGVKTNMTSNSAVFEDGSIVFTTDGALNVGNPLEAEFELEGHKIAFKGTDILAFRFKDGKPDFRYGTAELLTLDGVSLI
jgi:hypothetical protein